MSAETPLPAFFNAASTTEVQQPVVEQPKVVPSPEPTADEARAVEAVFAQQQESDLVAGLLGLWTGALVLHDVAVETFSPAADEEEDRKRKKEKEPSDDEPSS